MARFNEQCSQQTILLIVTHRRLSSEAIGVYRHTTLTPDNPQSGERIDNSSLGPSNTQFFAQTLLPHSCRLTTTNVTTPVNRN